MTIKPQTSLQEQQCLAQILSVVSTASYQMSGIAREVGLLQIPQVCVQCKFDTPSDKRGRPPSFIYPSYAANLRERVLTDSFDRTYVNYCIF